MNFKRFLLPSIAVVMGLCAFTSCIDEDYDLSNVDTTTQFQVKDLVLPINIDEIAMNQFVSIADTGRIQVINGQYVLIDSGTYESDEIIIPEIKIPAPSVPTIKSTITLIEDNTPSSLKAAMPTFPLRFDIGRQMSAFTYKQGGVTDFIVDMDLIGAEYITSSHGISVKNATKDLNNQGSQFLPNESIEFVNKIEEILNTVEQNGFYEIS